MSLQVQALRERERKERVAIRLEALGSEMKTDWEPNMDSESLKADIREEEEEGPEEGQSKKPEVQ